jgi:hypothetical protein
MKIFSFILISSLLFSFSARADEVANPKLALHEFNIELDPASMLIGSFGGQVSAGITDSISFGIFGSYMSANYLFNQNYKGYRAGVQGTYYFSGNRYTHGWIVSPSFGYTSYDVTDDFIFLGSSSYSGHLKGCFAGIVGGYQWSYPNGFNFSLGLGVSVYAIGKNQQLVSETGDTDRYNSIYAGVMPTLLANIGYSF